MDGTALTSLLFSQGNTCYFMFQLTVKKRFQIIAHKTSLMRQLLLMIGRLRIYSDQHFEGIVTDLAQTSPLDCPSPKPYLMLVANDNICFFCDYVCYAFIANFL